MPAPVLTSVTPERIPMQTGTGRTVNVTLIGTGFTGGSAVLNLPDDWSYEDLTITSDTAATVALIIPDNYISGANTFTLTTSGGTSNALTLTIVAAGGVIYSMSMDYLDDDGCDIRRERWAPVICDERNRIFHRRARIDLETGISEDPELNPRIVLQYSDNYGKTWSNEIQRSVGAIGQFGKMVDIWRLGFGRSRIYRLVMTDPYPWRIADAYVELDQGMS